jgi:5-oxoprolinase (ATP-hydrolysing) subunit C
VRALVVEACGPGTSLQDGGRVGYQRYGVASSGAMDRLALAAANALVGNPAGAAAIEFTLLGGRFTAAGGRIRVAVAGAPSGLALDGQAVPSSATLTVGSGQVLAVGPMRAGVYAYLAVAGGFDLPPQLGSLSLHQRAALGGFHGRTLQAGDRLPLHPAPDGPAMTLPPVPLPGDRAIRVVLGPQDDLFTARGIETFRTAVFRVSQQADRMGYRLAGPAIEHAAGYNIVSDGIVWGSVQVPGSGEPICMMADRQTTGGYPKIATVASADLRVLAQRRPGDPVRFEAVGIEAAQRLARERTAEIAALTAALTPLRRVPTIEELLALNLAGAAVDALSGDS